MLRFSRNQCSKQTMHSAAAPHRRNRLNIEQLENRLVMTSWLGQIGGTGAEFVQGRSIMDTAGNIYIGGKFSEAADFDPGPGATNLTSAGGMDAFVAKYSADGTLQWGRRFGGSLDDVTNGLRLDATGESLYVTGNFAGNADFTGDNVADLTSAGSSDVFVLKLDPASGSTLWQKGVGGTSQDNGFDIATADGYVYVVGDFKNTADFNPGSGINSLTSAGKGKTRLEDGFVLKLTDIGNYVSAWQVGGVKYDSIRNLAIEAGGVYVLGSITGTVDINPTTGTYSLQSSGDWNDPFVASYATTGAVNWGRMINGPEIPAEAQLGSDAGSLYVTGEFGQTADCNPGGPGGILASAGSRDAFIAKYAKADGSFAWAKSFGGTGYDTSRGAAVVSPSDGSVYVGGWFYNTVDFNPGPTNGGELTSAGFNDGFLLKLDALGSYQNAWRMGGASSDIGAKPVGIIGSTVYITGGFQSNADFPTGQVLTSYGAHDIFLMAFDQPIDGVLLAAGLTTDSVEQSSAISTDDEILAAVPIGGTTLKYDKIVARDQAFAQADTERFGEWLGLWIEQPLSTGFGGKLRRQ